MSPITGFKEKDVLKFCQGRAMRCYRGFGAHVVDDGVSFAVWVPEAKRVRVVGDFNGWENSHDMSLQDPAGVWVLFVEGLGEGEMYKYQITTKDDKVFLKTDPFAFYREGPPGTSSVTYRLDGFEWSQEDKEWIDRRKAQAQEEAEEEARKEAQRRGGTEGQEDVDDDGLISGRPHRHPMLIYEVHLGSWKRREDRSFYTYLDLAKDLVPHVSALGYTHIQLMPVMEHLLDSSSGYQVSGYYAVSSRFGTPQDFMMFVDTCHRDGLGVILDWVPEGFCPDELGLRQFNGGALFEADAQDDVQNNGQEGLESLRFDFSRKVVWSFLISNAFYFLDLFHIDGLRMDITRILYKDGAAADEPKEIDRDGVDFVREMTGAVQKRFPGALLIAGDSGEWQDVTRPLEKGGLGFDFKWDLGWSSDVLRYASTDFPWRPSHHRLMTVSSLYMFSDHFVLPFSYGEYLRRESMLKCHVGEYEQKFAGMRALYCHFLAHPGKKMTFMGAEIAQFAEWDCNEGLEWYLPEYDLHRMFSVFVKAANRFYRSQSTLWAADAEEDGFAWIDASNAKQGIFCFQRKAGRYDDVLVVVLNLSPAYYDRFRIGVPAVYGEICWKVSGVRSQERFFEEVFNSDASHFGGTGKVNEKPLYVDHIPWNRCAESVVLSLPPLTGIFLKPGRIS
jgi:1,4-alpha-glucan branching enzyme